MEKDDIWLPEIATEDGHWTELIADNYDDDNDILPYWEELHDYAFFKRQTIPMHKHPV